MAEKKDAPKVLNLECNDGIVLGDRTGGIVETHMSSQSWSILNLLTGLVVGAADILILNLISQWYRYPVVLAVTISIVLLMLKLRRSYRFITLCQYLERTASGRHKIS